MSAHNLNLARGIRTALNPSVGVHGAWQWGVVQAVNANGTVDITLDGDPTTVITGVSYLTSYCPAVNDAVYVSRQQGPARTARVILGILNSRTPWGTLPNGYAQVTTNQTGISSITDLTNLAITVSIPVSNRRVEISAVLPNFQQLTSTASPTLYIREGATTLQTIQGATTEANFVGSIIGSVVITPTAGSHTYKLSLSTNNGTVNSLASSTEVAYIIAKDIGV